MLLLLLAVPSCIYSFWHGVIPTAYFIFIFVYLLSNILRGLFCTEFNLQCTEKRREVRIINSTWPLRRTPRFFLVHVSAVSAASYGQRYQCSFIHLSYRVITFLLWPEHASKETVDLSVKAIEVSSCLSLSESSDVKET